MFNNIISAACFFLILLTANITVAQDRTIWKEVEDQPSFPGCESIIDKKAKKACADEKLLGFIYRNISYPQIARENGIEGMVVVKFVVEKDGSITNPEVIRDIGGNCGGEALRVVEMMPKWEAGKVEGKPVRVQFNLPVKYKLEDDPIPTKSGQDYVQKPVQKRAHEDLHQIDLSKDKVALEVFKEGKKKDKKKMIEQVLGNPEAYSPPVLFEMSNVLFLLKKERMGLFWLFVAQIRLKYDVYRSGNQGAVDVEATLNAGIQLPKDFRPMDIIALLEIAGDAMDYVGDNKEVYDHRWINFYRLRQGNNSEENVKNRQPMNLPKSDWRKLKAEALVNFAKSIKTVESKPKVNLSWIFWNPFRVF